MANVTLDPKELPEVDGISDEDLLKMAKTPSLLQRCALVGPIYQRADTDRVNLWHEPLAHSLRFIQALSISRPHRVVPFLRTAPANQHM